MSVLPPEILDTPGTLSATMAGFAFGLGLIFSLGPQNLALVRAGLTRSHPIAAATTAMLSEITLVAVGIGGTGAMLAASPAIAALLQLAGIAFLLVCCTRALAQARGTSFAAADGSPQPRDRVIRTVLAVTWLNPLVYLEAVLFVGVLASGYGSVAQVGFAAGFLAASAVKFYGWSLAGARLSPWLNTPLVRRRFALASGLVLLAAALLLSARMTAAAWPAGAGS